MANNDWERRRVLQSLGAAVPSLRRMMEGAAGPAEAGQAAAEPSDRFTPVDLGPYFNSSPAGFGARDQARRSGGQIRLPSGKCELRGIPFWLGPSGADEKSWIVLSTRPGASQSAAVEIPIGRTATFICLAQFCDSDPAESNPRSVEDIERVGQRLADAVLVYADGREEARPIRRRFDVNPPSLRWGHHPFHAVAHPDFEPVALNAPLRSASQWGSLQSEVRQAPAGGSLLWICALENPAPERRVRALRLRAAAEDRLVVCGVTLFHGVDSPLRYGRLTLYRITVPDPGAEWTVDVDLGVAARTYRLPPFQPEAWLAGVEAFAQPSTVANNLRTAPSPKADPRYLYVEVSAAPDAVLTLRQEGADKSWRFRLRDAGAGREIEAETGGSRIQVLERDRVWVHGRVLDAGGKQTTPVRLAFRSPNGRYIAPHGHRTQVSTSWFQDYGADVKVGENNYAYVDGTFQIELPVGDVFVEATKGFEREPLRRKLQIRPDQRELTLELSRAVDMRSKGWLTADTHVHFLSTSTAMLEAEAEGLNLVNLLAAQWGEMYTNVGDLYQGCLRSKTGDTIVAVGTENRSHVMGHLALLGGEGEPVLPLGGGFPTEWADAWFGDPVRSLMAEWADGCHKRGGLTVAVHFPYPTSELAADIVLGKVDAIEIIPPGDAFNAVSVFEWYRYLNCGYRVPVVGGTDKMSARVPAGAARTYAYLGQEEFTFNSWAKAVRSGNTFTTTGPLLTFQVDGRVPGQEIVMRQGGGEVEFSVECRSFAPRFGVELVYNGRVVASRKENAGSREMVWRDRVKVPGPGWLAARCSSDVGRNTIAAHTSPVYLRIPGQEVFSPEAGAYILTLIEGTQTWLEKMDTRADAERFEQMRKILGDAHARMHARLKSRG